MIKLGISGGIFGAAAIGAIMLGGGEAAAQPLAIPGIGTFEIPDGIPVPAGLAPVAAPVTQTPAAIAVAAARSKVGTGYRAGSAGPNSFDCSGLVKWSYKQAGVDLPRTSYAQLTAGKPVSSKDLQPGDVVSFYGGSHSGIYAGDGKVIHAATSGAGVTTSPMSSMPYTGARRIYYSRARSL